MNKGFTLVELLAVLLVIAVIATITTISVNQVLSDSRETLSQTQKQNIEKAAKTYYLNENISSDNECVNVSTLINKGYIDSDTIINPEDRENMLGSVIITFKDNQYSYEYQDNYCMYENGEVVYFDVENGIGCIESDYNEQNSNTGYNGIDNKTGNQNSCLKFYAFNDDGGEKLNLILDHNTTKVIAWNSSLDNSSGPKEVIEQLKMDTEDWNGTIVPENYTLYQVGFGNYTIDYSMYKARLITANEITKIIKNKEFDESISPSKANIYFDSNNSTASETCIEGNTTGCSYGWLYDRTSSFCTTWGCSNNSNEGNIYGYWTSTSYFGSSGYAWRVYRDGQIHRGSIESNTAVGVRPVIEISKTKIN